MQLITLFVSKKSSCIKYLYIRVITIKNCCLYIGLFLFINTYLYYKKNMNVLRINNSNLSLKEMQIGLKNKHVLQYCCMLINPQTSQYILYQSLIHAKDVIASGLELINYKLIMKSFSNNDIVTFAYVLHLYT